MQVVEKVKALNAMAVEQDLCIVTETIFSQPLYDLGSAPVLHLKATI